MKDLSRPIRTDETLLCHIQRSRHWSSLLLRLAGSIAIILLVWRLFYYLNRSFIESYIRPWSTFGSSWLIVVNLFLSLVPALVLLALAQDFLYTFLVELSLTDRRIVGRVGGLVWLREVDLPLEQVQDVRLDHGHLLIERAGGRPLQVYGLPGPERFVTAYQERHLALPALDDPAYELPDAFTFQGAR